MSKQIFWTSWNAMSDDYLMGVSEEIQKIEEYLEYSQNSLDSGVSMPIIDRTGMDVIQTPFGVYPLESMFKPSDRWDCWIGTTNFDITKSIKRTLKRDIPGVEALRVLGRYTFCIGVPITFSATVVRKSIEDAICVYTESEVIDDITQTTIELIKDQIQDKKHWSILVTADKEIDYIVSDVLDKRYLDDLSKLVESKNTFGGIILRGDNG